MNATMLEGLWFICIGIVIGLSISHMIWLSWLIKQYMNREKELKKIKIKKQAEKK